MQRITPRKRFGQHFLRDPAIIRRIIDAFAPTAEDCIVEIGPGDGALTAALLARVPYITAVEFDRDLVRRLSQQYPATRLRLIQQDILTVALPTLIPPAHPRQKLRVIGNLPYNISTPLLFQLAATPSHLEDVVCMVQQEVAQRIIAQPGESAYGRLSVMLQLALHGELLFSVPPTAFYPPPAVTSAVLHLRPCPPQLAITNPNHLATLVKDAFAQRRKMLRNSCAHLPPEIFTTANIDPMARAQDLSGNDFITLSNLSAPID